MKKIYSIAIVILAGAAVIASCSKETDFVNETAGEQQPASAKTITLSATLSDNLTKVGFSPVYDGVKPTGMELTWAEGDKLLVANHANPEQNAEFALAESCIGKKIGSFSGEMTFEATSYDVSIVSGDVAYGTQTQPSDGVATGLKYLASASEVTDLKSIVFDSFSSVLAITAKMPSTEVAAAIKSVYITASEDIFAGGKTLTITLGTPGDAGADAHLQLFATLPKGNQAIAAGTTLLVHFNAPDTDHTVYTRYIVLPAQTFTANKLNSIGIDASKSDQHAGLVSCDGTTAEKAYLIGDKYQMKNVNTLATGGATTYFKMVDNVDMTGVTHVPINTNTGYTQLVNFNGNNKTVSNLTKNLFYVFKGTIYDLTIDKSVVTARGILAEYLQGYGHNITNVKITNGSVTSTTNNVGGMIGRINSNTTANYSVTISNCEVSKTNVTGAGAVGGVLGYNETKTNVSDCKYTGGTVTASGQYVGGFVGSIGNYASVFTSCQVEDAIVNANGTNDVRAGGFAGIVQDAASVKGCTVGTSTKEVTINTKEPTKTNNVYNVINAGGFAGVCYGLITKNEEVRSKAYVKITSTNAQGTPLKIGGFVGYHSGTIEYSDAVVDMSGLKGQHLGGFAGYVTRGADTKYGNIDNCTASGSITGNNFTGGFIGFMDANAPEISNCTASGTITGQSGSGGFVGQINSGSITDCSTSKLCTFTGSNNGGFVGWLDGGTFTGCSATGNVSTDGTGFTFGGFAGFIPGSATIEKCFSTGNVSTTQGKSYFAGFIGQMKNGTVVIKRCYSTGNAVTAAGYASGFIACINQDIGKETRVTIENCYATGDAITGDQIRGGLVAAVVAGTSVKISNCYAAGNVSGGFRIGGLIGNQAIANCTVEKCVAWNSAVTASDVAQGKWSSGAVVGTAFPKCTLTDNYRKPGMQLKAYWGNVTGYTYLLADDYQHANVSSSHPLVKQDGNETTATALASGQDGYPQFPYHGKVEAGKTLSQLAKTTLGWSSDIWDFDGELPTLKPDDSE